MRFDQRMHTQRLKKVHDISATDMKDTETGMTVCSPWLLGHALVIATNEPLPEPDNFLREIQRMEKFVDAMRKRGRT